jgi:hypothetical protein
MMNKMKLRAFAGNIDVESETSPVFELKMRGP